MALAIPALAIGYLLTAKAPSVDPKVQDAMDKRDGREKMPKKAGRSSLDPNYLRAVHRPNPFVGVPPVADQRRGILINRPIPLPDQVARQNLLFEVRRSGANGGGGLGSATLLRDKYMNRRALQLNRRAAIHPGLTVVAPVAYAEPEAPMVYDDVGASMVSQQELVSFQPSGPAPVFGAMQ